MRILLRKKRHSGGYERRTKFSATSHFLKGKLTSGAPRTVGCKALTQEHVVRVPVRGRTAELQTGGKSVTQVCLERGIPMKVSIGNEVSIEN